MVVAIIAITIGANIAIYTLVDRLIVRAATVLFAIAAPIACAPPSLGATRVALLHTLRAD